MSSRLTNQNHIVDYRNKFSYVPKLHTCTYWNEHDSRFTYYHVMYYFLVTQLRNNAPISLHTKIYPSNSMLISLVIGLMHDNILHLFALLTKPMLIYPVRRQSTFISFDKVLASATYLPSSNNFQPSPHQPSGYHVIQLIQQWTSVHRLPFINLILTLYH